MMAYNLKTIADGKKILKGAGARVSTCSKVIDESGFMGVARFVTPYALHEKPEYYYFTTHVYKLSDDDPYVMVTGKTYIVRGVCVAVQILQAMDGHPCLKWTSRGSLEFMNSAPE